VDETLLKNREAKYGNTWFLAGKVVEMLRTPYIQFIRICPEYSHNWMMILSKLIRILFSPYDIDHWRDIAGYATLVQRDLEVHDDVPS